MSKENRTSASEALDEAMRRAAEAFHNVITPVGGTLKPVEAMQAALASLARDGFVLVPRETLNAAKRQAIALVVGSCSCGMKTPNAALHPADCRYAVVSGLLENLEEVLAAAPKAGGSE